MTVATIIVLAAAAQTPAAAPTTLSGFIESPGYQATIARIFDTLPAEIFRRCPALVGEGSQVTMTTPVRFEGGRPVAGEWRQSFPVRGCGNDTVINLFFAASPEAVRSGVGAPGTTHAGLVLQRDALRYARIAALPLAGGCAALRLVDTRYDGAGGADAHPVGGTKAGKPWGESWTLAGCGHRVVVPVTFVPDATGTTIATGRATGG